MKLWLRFQCWLRKVCFKHKLAKKRRLTDLYGGFYCIACLDESIARSFAATSETARKRLERATKLIEKL